MANTFKFGNGNWATKEGKILAYNDQNNNFKPLPFDFTRASTATRVNKAGLIETVASGVPRIDYLNDANGALLLEPSRTNVFLQSNQFDTSWVKSNITISSGEVGVAGGLGAWKITANSGSGDKKLIQSPSISGSTMVSVYAKAGTRDYVYLRGVTSGANKRVYFNLSNGTVGTNEGLSADMVNMGNGWYRCIAQLDQQSGFEFYIGIAQNDNEAFYTDDGTGTIYVQYAQAEQGSYATSYIPTSGGIVTRVAETCNSAGNSQVFNDSEGVFFVEMAALANDGTNRIFGMSSASGFNDSVVIRYNGTADNNILAQIRLGGTYQCALDYFPSDATEFSKVAFKYKANDFELYAAGALQEADTSGGTITGLEDFGFSFVGGNQFYGKIKSIKIYDTALTDAELIALTL